MTGKNSNALSKKPRPLTTLLAVSGIAGFILSFLAPYGTHKLNYLWRLLYWVSLCIAGGLGTQFYKLIEHKFSTPQAPWFKAIGQSIGATIMVAIFVLGMNKFHGWTALFMTLFDIWIIAIVLCGLSVLFKHKSNSKPTTHTLRPALYERLPPKLRQADIYAIASEDHYIRVYTSLGEDMILMRLSDAIKEMSPLKGLSPHRSWWVAESGVEKLDRKNGKTIITLKNNIIAPVSRTGQKAIKDAGWV